MTVGSVVVDSADTDEAGLAGCESSAKDDSPVLPALAPTPGVARPKMVPAGDGGLLSRR